MGAKHLYHPPYRNDIDGLRALAVLPVVLFHAFPTCLSGGFTGVDVFFVISGFIISSILFSSLDHDRFSLLEFYERRARRLFPALIVVFTFCLVIGWLVLFSDEYAELGKHVLAGSGFVQNFNLLSEAGYFDTASVLKPLLHIWSLSVEEQFYVFWPILLVVTWRYRMNFLLVTLAVLVISFALNIYLTRVSSSYAFYLPVSRFWELMIGGLGAYLVKRQNRHLNRVANFLPWIGLAMLAVGYRKISEGAHFPGWVALLPAIGALFILVGNPQSLVARGLSLPQLVWIGKISYPLYLWHWPLLAFARIGVHDGTFREPPAYWLVAAIVLSILFAWLTYRFVERPIRYADKSRSLFSLSMKNRAIACTAALALLAGAGGAIYLAGGLPSRIQLTPISATGLFEPYPHKMENDNCRSRFKELNGSWSCLLSKPADPEVLLIGDSHAHQYYSSLAKMLPDHSIMNYSVPACLPFSRDAITNPGCAENLTRLFKFVEAHPTIKTVVMAGYFSFLEGGFKFGNIEGKRVANDTPAPEDRAAFAKAADMVLGEFTQQEKRIVVLRDIPDIVFSPRSCVSYDSALMGAVRGMGQKRSIENCGVGLDEFQARNKSYDEDLSGILAKYPHVVTLDPRPLLCTVGFCRAAAKDEFLYWNSDHLTIAGADLIIGHFAEQLRSAAN